MSTQTKCFLIFLFLPRDLGGFGLKFNKKNMHASDKFDLENNKQIPNKISTETSRINYKFELAVIHKKY